MTTDEFNTKYKLLKQIAHGKGRTFTAQECASERAVLVHFLAEGGQNSSPAVATLVDRLAPADRSKVLEILAVNVSTVVVTQYLENFEGFDTWLQSRLAGPATPAPDLFSQPMPAPSGEFTKLFESPAPPPPAPQSPAQPAVAVPDEGARGSFTELFRPPPESRSNPHPMPAPAAPPVEILSVRIPVSEPHPHPPPPPRPAIPLPSWPSSLGSDPAASPNPVLPAPMLRPRPGEPIVKPPQRDVLPPPLPVPGWSGESDYTRQLRPNRAPVDPAPLPLAPSPAPEPPRGESRSLVPLLLVLNIVVIIATGVILYFALKRR